MKKQIYNKLVIIPMVLSFTMSAIGCGASTETEENAQGTSESTESTLEQSVSEEKTSNDSENDYNMSQVGINFHLPDEYINTEGLFDLSGAELSSGDGVYYASAGYVGISAEEYQKIAENENRTDDELNYVQNHYLELFSIFSIDADRNRDDIVNYLETNFGDTVVADDFTEITTVDGVTFYEYVAIDDSNLANLDENFATEYANLVNLKDDVIKNATYSKPVSPYEGIIGQKVFFETTDIDGNVITSEEIFSQHELTMVNVWATWCVHCVNELEELGNINGRLAEKDCAIVGLVGDGDTELEKARELLAENSVTYLNILPWDGWQESFDMSAGWPISFFVDKTGTIVASPVIGADVTGYEDKIDSILSGENNTSLQADQSVENSEGKYRIYVIDQNSDPVIGAMVQFCTDETCKMGQTDETGMAAFDEQPGVYDVHILKVPDGYKEDSTGYKTIDKYSDLTIVLEKE